MEILLGLILTCDPPITDRDRFPPRCVAYDAMRFNRAYRRHLECCRWSLDSHHAEELADAIRETDHLYRCWDWLHAAQGGEARDEAYWRESLRVLKELIGDEAYFSGSMPPAVPVWRFRPVR